MNTNNYTDKLVRDLTTDLMRMELGESRNYTIPTLWTKKQFRDFVSRVDQAIELKSGDDPDRIFQIARGEIMLWRITITCCSPD